MAQTRSKEVSTKTYRPSFLDTAGDLRPSVERELVSISNAIKAESDKFKYFRPHMDSEGYYIYPTGSGGGYVLPAASASVRGGIRVGSGLTISGDVLSATGGGSYTLPVATSSVLGGVKVGSGITITSDGTISATSVTPIDSYTKTESDAKYETKTDATTSLSLKADKATTYTKTETDAAITAKSYTLPVASATVLGGVKQGTNITIAADGTISTTVSGGGSGDVTAAGDNTFTGANTFEGLNTFGNIVASSAALIDLSGADSVKVPNTDVVIDEEKAVNGKAVYDFALNYIGLSYEVTDTLTVDLDAPTLAGSGGGLGKNFLNKPALVPTADTDICIFTLQSFGKAFTYKFENLTTGLVAVRTLKDNTGPLSPWVLEGDGTSSGGNSGLVISDTFTNMDTNTANGWFRTKIGPVTGGTPSLSIVPNHYGDYALVNHVQKENFAYQTAFIGGPNATDANSGKDFYFRVKPDSNPWVAWQKMSSGGAITEINVGTNDFPITASHIDLKGVTRTNSAELYGATPFVDFHFGETTPSATDFNVRIMNDDDGVFRFRQHDATKDEGYATLGVGTTNVHGMINTVSSISPHVAVNLSNTHPHNATPGSTNFSSRIQMNAIQGSTGHFALWGEENVNQYWGGIFEVAWGADAKYFKMKNNGKFEADGVELTSDRTLKKNIQPIDNALDKVDSLTGCSWDWKSGKGSGVGLIAQDVEEVLPEAVGHNGNNYVLDYQGIIGLLVNAVKELKEEVKQLKENK